MLILLLVACAHRAAPAAPAAPAEAHTEAERRAACATGSVAPCLSLVAWLEGELPSPENVREAVEIAARFEAQDLLAGQVSTLVANAHPEVASPEARARAWRTLCATHGSTAGCEVGGWELQAERPEDARALWDEACRDGSTHLCAPASPGDVVPAELPEGFRQGLATVGASFHMPRGFHVVESPDNPHFQTEFAMLSDDGRLEVRYGVRDDTRVLSLTNTCKAQPGCISADFMAVEQSMALVTLANVGQIDPSEVKAGALPALPVRIEFNAHWGITGTVVADALFTPDKAPVSAVVLHQDPAANLYVFFIYHDLSAMADLQPAAFHALRFTRPVGLGGSWMGG